MAQTKYIWVEMTKEWGGFAVGQVVRFGESKGVERIGAGFGKKVPEPAESKRATADAKKEAKEAEAKAAAEKAEAEVKAAAEAKAAEAQAAAEKAKADKKAKSENADNRP